MTTREYTPGRFLVFKDAKAERADNHCGIVEKHEYIEGQLGSSKRVKQTRWYARPRNAGTRRGSLQRCRSKEEAARYVVDQSTVKYQDRRARWAQGQ